MTTKPHHALPAAALALIGLFVFSAGIAVNYTFIDEVYFAEPAINFLNGHGYTTAVWHVTGESETHVSTAPAYSFLLLLWLKIFGISQTAVRSLPPVLALGGAFVFWRACWRSGLIKTGLAGAIVIGVPLLDYGFAFSYTCGRPEALSVLAVAAMFYFSTLENKRAAVGAIGAISILIPFVQWGCVIYLVCLGLALLLISKGRNLPFILAMLAGLMTGLLFQRLAYAHFGIWETWMNTIKSEGSDSIVGRIGYRMTLDALLHHHSNNIPKDFSALVILAGFALLYLQNKILRRPDGMRFAKSAWIMAATVTTGMYFVGKFPTYYSWMLSFPLAAMLGSYHDQVLPAATNRLEIKLVAFIAVLACGVGLPMQAGLASHDWQERKPAAITAWLGPIIRTNDVVYCDYPFYYIAKQRAEQVFAGHYFAKLTPAEFDRITLVIIAAHDSEWKQSKHPLPGESAIGSWQPSRSGIIGNDWQFGILSTPNYACTVYRLK